MKIVGIPKCVPLFLPSQRDSLLPFSSSLALSSKTKIERNKSYPLKINIIYFYHKISIFLNCAHKFFKQMRDLHSENRKIKRKERVTDWIKTNSVPPHPSFSLNSICNVKQANGWIDYYMYKCPSNVERMSIVNQHDKSHHLINSNSFLTVGLHIWIYFISVWWCLENMPFFTLCLQIKF